MDDSGTAAPEPRPEASEMHLREHLALLLRRKKLVIFLTVAGLAGALAITLLTTPEYRAITVLHVEREQPSPMEIGTPAERTLPSTDPDFVATQTRLMRSREVAERAVRSLKLGGRQVGPDTGPSSADSAVTRAALELQFKTDVNPIRGTTLVELAYSDPDAKRAAAVANALADSYIDWGLESKFRLVGQTSQFLAGQIDQAKDELDAKEKQLLAYGRQKDIVSTDPQANVTLQKLEQLNRDYATAVSDRVAKEARYRSLESGSADSIADSTSGGLVSQLKAEQARLEREYAEKLNLFKPEWPAMQQLKAQIEKGRQHLDGVIRENADKARQTAKADYETEVRREANLRSVLQSQKSEAMALNTSAVEYNNIRVEVETKRALLDQLLKKQAETEVLSRLRGERVSNIRVVDSALVPAKPWRPSYPRNLLLGLLGGLSAGVGLAFFLSYMDRSLRSAEDVEKWTGLPPLGLVPSLSAVRAAGGYPRRYRKDAEGASIELGPHDRPHSAVAESYRALRAALLLSRAGGIKSMVITSAVPEEGKTATCVNLAIVLAQLRRRVLLVDADLHKPRLHEVLHVSNRIGLVSVLAEEMDTAKAIAPTSVPNLFLLPAGPASPNPSGLLSSEGMSTLLQAAAMNFDYIVIDSPPVFPVADALVLGAQTDGVVLCVKGGSTPRELVTRVRDKLARANVRILGVVLNDVPADPTTAAEYRAYGGYYAESAAAERRAADGSERPEDSSAALRELTS
jgi:capsular exopolysaccharide synthesis family protein